MKADNLAVINEHGTFILTPSTTLKECADAIGYQAALAAFSMLIALRKTTN